MLNYRSYGDKPYKAAVVHGGPGAPGSVAAVARELSGKWGVLEPLQTATTLKSQVKELYETLCSQGDMPVTLIGHSWGAWLSYILAAEHPHCVEKLILVCSGPFEEKYVEELEEKRFSRMSMEEKAEAERIIEYLYSGDGEKKDEKLARLGQLVEKSDNYDTEEIETDGRDRIAIEGNTYRQVWDEAAILRKSGKLLEYGRSIICPVIGIHGDYDPHPAEGVREPLSRTISDFSFHLLEKCGHTPWKERYAREEFYRILKREIL